MPSYRDNDDVVHDVALRGSGSWSRCGIRFVPDEAARYGWAPEQRVNCVGCLNTDEPLNDQDLFVVCNGCGQWWREEGEELVIASSEETRKMGSGFLAMSDGTLLSCRKCRAQ